MKSEKQIRRLMQRLEQGINSPCDCAGAEHHFECEAGAKMMRAQLAGLKWVLGEASDADVFGPLTPPWIAEGN